MFSRLSLALLVFFSSTSFAAELGLDLSPESAVKEVVLIPPIYKVASTEGGSFAGFQSAKVTEKLDLASHKRLVTALEKALGTKQVISPEATTAAIAKENLKLANLRTAAGMAQLAKATNAAWVIFYDVNKGVLAASIYTLLGETTGKTASISGMVVGSLTVAQADDLQKQLSKHLVALSQPKPEEVAAKPVEPPLPPPPAEEPEITGEVDSEIARERAARRSVLESADLSRPRIVVALGAGAVMRNQSITGSAASSLAELKNSTAIGATVYAAVSPLHFFRAFDDKPYRDLFFDLNYRRAFIKATGTSGGLEGQTCGVVDDELQARANFRWRLGGMLPAIGLGAGWAQERAAFTGCSLPVVSAIYRGVDVQLRIKQPLFRDIVTLDLAVGPRILVAGPLAPKTGLSWAGEAWVEARPIGLLYLRGGARFFRAVLSDDVGVATADLRAFVALEAGVQL